MILRFADVPTSCDVTNLRESEKQYLAWLYLWYTFVVVQNGAQERVF